MDSQEIKQRSIRDDTDNVSSSTDKDKSGHLVRSRQEKKIAMAKRGLRSLAIAVSLPVSLNLLNIYIGSTKYGYGSLSKPFWFPPTWALHLTSLASNFLMGVSAWLVWAEGGFHRKSATIWLYLSHLLLVLVWESIVFGAGARSWIGLIVCLAMFGTLGGCSRFFKQVHTTAGYLTKPCLAWTAFLLVVNLKLVFH